MTARRNIIRPPAHQPTPAQINRKRQQIQAKVERAESSPSSIAGGSVFREPPERLTRAKSKSADCNASSSDSTPVNQEVQNVPGAVSEVFFAFFGRPRGRNVISRPSRIAALGTHASSPAITASAVIRPSCRRRPQKPRADCQSSSATVSPRVNNIWLNKRSGPGGSRRRRFRPWRSFPRPS